MRKMLRNKIFFLFHILKLITINDTESKMSTVVRSLCMLFSVLLLTVIIPSEAIDNQCGTVSLRTEKVVENGTVKIEYRPSSNAMYYRDSLERKWSRYVGRYGKTLKLNAGTYTEKKEQHYKYVLIIYRFNVSMNGQYRVYCGSPIGRYTDPVTVNLPEPPSAPVIVGLQDIENCRDCIVAEDNETIALACVIHGGTRPLTVIMTLGNETYFPQNKSNSTTYMVYFTVRDHHHKKNVIFSVMNDALPSPLKATAQMFVIKPPVIGFNISGSTLDISEGERAHVKCEADSVPASNVSWIEELSNGNRTKKQCNLTPNCVLNIDTDEVSNRRFKCQVHYKTKVYHKYLTIHIKDKVDEDDKYNNKQKTTGQASDKSIIWIILGACVLVVVIIVIAVLFLVFRKKGQTLQDKREGRVHHDTQEGHARCTIQKSEDRPAGQLLYADLAFDPNAAPSKAAVAKQEDSPTEYVDIDYVKTKANKEIDDVPTKQENLILCTLLQYKYVNNKGAHVSKIEPKYGSLAGETRLTIYGGGFSADQFSQNDDPNVGNRVYLVGESGTEFSCIVHKDGCTETQIMCYTPRGMTEEDHYVKVKVDGDVVADSDLCGGDPTSFKCTFK
ncbi:uncharacterized protein LOC132714142, partial [Ruditapes philippinarum]|uniref:uncharacterized protein LOC132714142 n=1 Tax=Ruditapes philippinarum TaxID=129788 RepID=UPI00295A6DB6